MRDRDKLRRLRRANEVQAETLDEYRNTINFLEARNSRLEAEIEKIHLKQKEELKDAFNESRKTHPMLGFKHETFNDYYKTKENAK